MVIFDANMILCYLLDDDHNMVTCAEHYLQTGNVWVTIEVIAEVFHVLKGVYAMKRQDIAESVLCFLELVKCKSVISCTWHDATPTRRKS